MQTYGAHLSYINTGMSFHYMILQKTTNRFGALHTTRRQRQRLENSRGGYQPGARMSGSMPFSVLSGVKSMEKSLRRTGH